MPYLGSRCSAAATANPSNSVCVCIFFFYLMHACAPHGTHYVITCMPAANGQRWQRGSDRPNMWHHRWRQRQRAGQNEWVMIMELVITNRHRRSALSITDLSGLHRHTNSTMCERCGARISGIVAYYTITFMCQFEAHDHRRFFPTRARAQKKNTKNNKKKKNKMRDYMRIMMLFGSCNWAGFRTSSSCDATPNRQFNDTLRWQYFCIVQFIICNWDVEASRMEVSRLHLDFCFLYVYLFCCKDSSHTKQIMKKNQKKQKK